MQTVRKQHSASPPICEVGRRDKKPSGVSTVGNQPFVRAPARTESIDRTAPQARTVRAMHDLQLATMSTEGMNIAADCYGLPAGTEVDLHNSVNPLIRQYAKELGGLVGMPGPVSVKFDSGLMTVRSKWSINSAPIFSMHRTQEGVRYVVQGHPLNGSSSSPDIQIAQSHLSMCKLIAHEAVDPEGARQIVAAYQA